MNPKCWGNTGDNRCRCQFYGHVKCDFKKDHRKCPDFDWMTDEGWYRWQEHKKYAELLRCEVEGKNAKEKLSKRI